AATIVALSHRYLGGKPAQRLLVVVQLRDEYAVEAAQGRAVVRAEVHQPVFRAVVGFIDEQLCLKALDVARAEVHARHGARAAVYDVAGDADQIRAPADDRAIQDLRQIVHDLQVVQGPEPVFPSAETVRARRDDRLHLRGAIR